MKTEIQKQAFEIYAALGELYLRKKQSEQFIESINIQINNLEAQIIELATKDEKSEEKPSN